MDNLEIKEIKISDVDGERHLFSKQDSDIGKSPEASTSLNEVVDKGKLT